MNIDRSSREKASNSRKGTVVIEILVALGIYAIALSMIYESITVLSRTITSISNSQKQVENFEDILLYINSEIKGNDFELIHYNQWSILLIDTNPVIGYQIIYYSDGYCNLRRIVANIKVDIKKLKEDRYGLKYFNDNFSGFNRLYFGNDKLFFEMEDNYLIFKFNDIKTYLGIHR